MDTTAQGALPGAAVADHYIEKMRALFFAERLATGARLWELMNPGERRALAKRAQLDAALGDVKWADLGGNDRQALLAAWAGLRARVEWLAVQLAR